MRNIIKNGVIVADSWTIVHDESITSLKDLPAGDLILPLATWRLVHDEIKDLRAKEKHSGIKLPEELHTHCKIGVWLNSHESAAELKTICHSLPIIAINFPIFTDGRGYSTAHILRAQFKYSGELRAIGDVLRDQLFFMKRCGFDSFAMRADQKLELAVNNLNDFTLTYQAAIDKTTPLFQDR